MGISVIKKRDGRIVPFDLKKISEAIEKSFVAGEPNRDHEALATSLAWEVYTLLDLEGNPAPTVEHVQDIVEQVLMREGYSQTAKSYILYRQERTNVRNREPQGRGTVTVAPGSGNNTLVGQALVIYGAVRDNGGCESLRGFFEALTPALAEEFRLRYGELLGLTLETSGLARSAGSAVRACETALERQGLAPALGENEAYLSRQADLLCGTLGCDRAPVQAAQRAAAAAAQKSVWLAAQQTMAALLSALNGAGCDVQAIDRGGDDSTEARLLRDLVR